MVADIGHRYIFLRERKGARWNIKRSAAPYSKRWPPPRSVTLPRHPRSILPPPIYGAFCTFDIFYCRSPLFVLFMFLLGPTLGGGHPASALAWPAAILKVPRPLSRKIHPPFPYTAGQWILRRICSWCKHAAILKRYISAMPHRNGCAWAIK